MRLLVFVLCLTSALQAAAPIISELRPRGAERGRPFTLTVVGRNLIEGARVRSTMPAHFTPLAPALDGLPEMSAPGRYAAFLVEPKEDIPPGLYPIRIETPEGISNILLFAVGSFPETTEAESQPGSLPNRNDSIETAESILTVPITVNGTLRGPERDIFRVRGKAGERRVFEIEARRCGSAVDPVLEITDSSGKVLARSEDTPLLSLDARVDFTFPHDGDFYVWVRDARYSSQNQNFYRLKMGNYDYVDAFFPLGGRRGELTEVTLERAAARRPSTAKIDLRRAAGDLALLSPPDSPVLPFVFAVSDLPELREPLGGPAPVPSVINGRLDKEGEIDRYIFSVEPGDALLFEMEARELGTSKLQAVVSVYDSDGKKLASAGDEPLPVDVFAVQGTSRTMGDPVFNFKVPDGVRQITVTIEDLALRGGKHFGYRLITRRLAQDFQLSIATPYVNIPESGTALITVNADRRGFDGPIRLRLENPPEGVLVEGGVIPSDPPDATALPSRAITRRGRGVLALTAQPGTKLDLRELMVIGEATLPDGAVLRRRAKGPGMLVPVAGATQQGAVDLQRPLTAPWLNLVLPAATTSRLPASLEVKPLRVDRLEEGDRHVFEWRWTATRPDIRPPGKLSVDVVGARDIRIIDMKQDPEDHNRGTFVVTTTKNTIPERYDLYANVNIAVDGENFTISSRPAVFEVLPKRDVQNVATHR